MKKGTIYQEGAVAIAIGAGWLVGVVALASRDFQHPERANYQTGLAGVALTLLAALLYGLACRWLYNRAAAGSGDEAAAMNIRAESDPCYRCDRMAQEELVETVIRSWSDHERIQLLSWLEENLIDMRTTQMHQLFIAAVDALGEPQAARRWLQTPITALGGKIPALYAKESAHAFHEVAALLARVRAGEYSV